MKSNHFILFLLFAMIFSTALGAQNVSEIIEKMTKNTLGVSNIAKMKMSIVRDDWKREIEMQSWTKGQNMALVLITAPPRDKGSAFLKRGKEIWNWQPGIDRIIKLPASMMMQSWMGSDFTNDDLVQQSSLIHDYDHRLLEETVVDQQKCYVIELLPKPEAPVVWGRLKIWIEKNHLYQLKTEFYDEDDYLVNTIEGSEVKKIQGRYLPTILTVTPEEEDESTVIEYLDVQFDTEIRDDFFSVEQMKKLNADDF